MAWDGARNPGLVRGGGGSLGFLTWKGGHEDSVWSWMGRLLRIGKGHINDSCCRGFSLQSAW